MNTIYLTLKGLLEWLSAPAGGAFIVVSMFISYFIEKFAFWQKLKKWLKIGIMVSIALLIRLGALWLVTNPAIMAQIEPVYSFIIASVIGWNVLELTHKTDK